MMTVNYPMLDRMENNRVFCIERDGELFAISERCDGYFGDMLNPDELRQLGQEIIAIANGEADVEHI